jgi:hypothetical protein
MKRAFTRLVLLLLAGLLIIQFIPQGRTNPPVTREVHWDAPATRALAERACLDCHSNVTKWPWYSHIAPTSFFVVGHVNDGRRRLNFSEWDQPQRATMDDVDDVVGSGEMPLWNYLIAHPEARLTPTETVHLLDGLRATFEKDPPTRRQR